MSSHVLSHVLAVALVSVPATAQSFNVDIHSDGSLTPPNSYGALPGQVGTWNTVSPSPSQTLLRLDGTSDDSTITFAPVPATFHVNSNIPAPHTDLFDDFTVEEFMTSVTNLQGGNYVLVLYSWFPGATTQFTVTDSSGAPKTATVSSAFGTPFPGFVEHVSFARFALTVSANAAVTIQVTNAGGEGCVLNGLQLTHYQSPVLGCTNQPLNSQGALPSLLASGTIDPATGGISIASNNLTLHCGLLPPPSGVLPSAVGAILCFVSNDNLANATPSCPSVGTRCIGLNNITRVWDPAALPGSGGVGLTMLPGNYNLSVDLNALVAQGITVAAGQTLHFQMTYRDDSLGACGQPTVQRWTPSLSVLLAP